MIGEKSPASNEGHKYPQKIVISTKAPSPVMAPFDLSPRRVLINKIYNQIPHTSVA